jgi:hypothetical protein
LVTFRITIHYNLTCWLNSFFFLLLYKICGRSLRVDHVENYRLPKHLLEKEDQVEAIISKNSSTGHAYHGKELANDYNLERGQDLFAPPPPSKNVSSSTSIRVDDVGTRDRSDESIVQRKERKRLRKELKHNKRSRKDHRRSDSHRSSRDRDVDDDSTIRKKKKRKHHDR